MPGHRTRIRKAAGLVLAAFLGLATGASASVPAWTTYHHDAMRSGFDPDSTSPLTPTQLWQTTPALDGPIFAQPLVYGSRVYVATENDSVYALDAATGAVIWHRSAGTPVPAGELPCGDIGPNVGVTSTPVIDPTTRVLYVVASNWDGSSVASIEHRLIGFDLATGAPSVSRNVDPPGSTAAAQLQRAALALDVGEIIIPYGGNAGDCGTYHGWLVGARADGTGQLLSYQVSPLTGANPGSAGGAIWGSGNGPVVDGNGDIFVATGNGFNESSYNYSESVLRLDSALNLLDYWAPANWMDLDNNDTDIGSSEPLPLPGGLLFQSGKDGNGYLMYAGALGHVGAAAAQLEVCPGEVLGGGVYAAGIVYVACGDGLQAVTVNTSAPTPTMTLEKGWTVTPDAIGPPIIAGGLVWTAGWNTGVLYGLDPTSGAIRFSENLGSFMHFTSPSAGGGRLFIANDDKVTALTIAAPPPPTPTTTVIASSVNPSQSGRTITFTATVSPAPDAGTISVSDGRTIAGCGAVTVSWATGKASCQTTYAKSGSHTITATYSGDAYFAASHSPKLTQTVKPPAPPRLSSLRVHPSVFKARMGTRLRLTISERATVTVSITQSVVGHKVKGRCKATARHGKRCAVSVQKAKLSFLAEIGRDTFGLRLRGLAPGSYKLLVSARDGVGTKSTSSTLTLRIEKP